MTGHMAPVIISPRAIASTGKEKSMARRRYQKGNLTLRGKSKMWVARWREDVKNPDGTVSRLHRSQVLGSLTDFPTKRLAQRALDRLLMDINAVDYRPRAKVLFDDFAQQWLETVVPQHKPSSQQFERGVLKNHILPFFSHMDMRDIDRAVVQRFIASIQAAPKTVRNVWSVLCMMWTTAKNWGYVSHDIDGIQLPRKRPVERKFF